MSHIRVTTYVRCPFSAAVELAEKMMGSRKGMYVSPAPPFGERVRFAATSTDDCTDEVRKHDALLIAWRPRNHAFFPEFRGALTVRPERRGACLQLYGEYTPLYGRAGKVFDSVIGRAIARRTMRRFLTELAAEVEAAYIEEQEHPKTA